MRRACMLVHSFYPDDPRVRREAEALLDDRWGVDVICLRGDGEKPFEECNGARVHRLPVKRHRGSGQAVYLLEYLAFFFLASLRLARLHLQNRYSVVHVHNMPDFLVFAGLLPKLLGARLVLDIHDPMPELYMAKFGGSGKHPAVRTVRVLERASTGLACHVITVSQPARRSLLSRGTPDRKLTVVMNTADPLLFHAPAGIALPTNPDCFTLVYHGTISERYGLDTLIKAVDRVRTRIPQVRLRIYGQGELSQALQQLVTGMHLGGFVEFGGRVPIADIPQLIAAADLGVAPLRKNAFTDLTYSTKAFEYISMGVPVITAATRGMLELFGDVPDMFFESDSIEELAGRIMALYSDPERLRRLQRAAETAYSHYTWEKQRRTFVTLIDELVAEQSPLPQQAESS